MRRLAAAVVVIGGWIACGPLIPEGQRGQPVTGSGSMFPPFDAPFDTPMEGSGSGSGPPLLDAPPFDAPSDVFVGPPDVPMEGGSADAPADIATEGGGSDAPGDAGVDASLGELPPDGPSTMPDGAIDAAIDARPDAPPDAAIDAAILVDARPDAPRDAAGDDASGMIGTPFNYQNTSFYDCQCSHNASPLGGWPLGVAFALIIFRRRSGSSSAR